jgi:Peptidase family C54
LHDLSERFRDDVDLCNGWMVELGKVCGKKVKAMLSIDWWIDIFCGRPKHSLYFDGYQDDKLIHRTSVKTLKMSMWRTSHLQVFYSPRVFFVKNNQLFLVIPRKLKATQFSPRIARKMWMRSIKPELFIVLYLAKMEIYYARIF